VTERTSEGADRRELALFSLGLAALTAFILWLSDGVVLFTRPLWVDEWLTMYVAQRSSPVAVIGDLVNGADAGASLFHLAVWSIRGVVGSLSPTFLRAMSLLCAFGALVLVYAVLRRHFSSHASVAGVLAVGSHRLVVAHEFEARFYGPWLLCCAFFAWSLSLNQRLGASRRRQSIVALAAILLCTVHWYGIITLGLMSSAVVASYGRRWREGLRLVAPGAAGVVALLLVAPLAFGQRGAYTVPTWLPDFHVSQIPALSNLFWLAAVPLLATVALLAGVMLRWRRTAGPSAANVARDAFQDAGVLALSSLLLMPLALAALSIMGQPSMLDRYALPAALGWGPWVALALELLGRWPARVFSIVLAWFWFVSFTKEASVKRAFASAVHWRAEALRQGEASGLPVAFQSINTMYPVVGESWMRRSSAVFLELSDSTLNAIIPARYRNYWFTRAVRLERDIARVHARRFGFPRLASQTALDTTPRFLLLAPVDRLPPGVGGIEAFGRAVFPHHRVVPVLPDLYLFERVPPGR
jgi:hypothetical protein